MGSCSNNCERNCADKGEELEAGVCPVDGVPDHNRHGSFLKKAIWHGGSIYDAWLNVVSAQVGQVILSLPTSYTQMGYKLGLFFHFFHVAIGMYTCYVLSRLYVEYRDWKEEGEDFKKHVIQVTNLQSSISSVILDFLARDLLMKWVRCAHLCDEAYYLNPHLTKRTWVLIFEAASLGINLLPSIHNFRVFSITGVLTTTHTSWFLLIAAKSRGQSPGVKHSAPIDLKSFFTGTTNILFGSGGHAANIQKLNTKSCIFVVKNVAAAG
uniref:Amino acid transporter transmembrane domain-containing protein n=1 Tax=Physcomitrium patens TaxID=3218 RepID=A0A7I4BHR8_PHYPA